MKLIPLYGKYGTGKFAQVDDEDYDFLMQWKWLGRLNCRNLYVTRYLCENNKCYPINMHRVVLGNPPNHIFVDHKDHNELNNQKSNLRLCNGSENMQNRRAKINGTSKYLGVRVWKQQNKNSVYSTFVAQITTNKKTIHLGSFQDEIMAAKAYDEAAKKYHGEFANLNFKNIDK